jgi:CDP-diacylglycerol--glycerol-3-phosphate 3-phosphatidyltransferase
MNVPNLITLSRLLGLPFLFVLCLSTDPVWQWWGLGIFLLAASTDWLDGYLARRLGQVTELGKFLDPLVDKLLVLGPYLILVQQQIVPSTAVFLILGRELAIAGWRVNPHLGGGEAIRGANIWGKLKTVTQITAIALLIAPLPDPWPRLGLMVFWFSLALTLLSGLIYIWPQKNASISSSVEKSGFSA